MEQGFTKAGDYLFFFGDDGENGRHLWVSDGTEAGTVRLEPEGTTDALLPCISDLQLAEHEGAIYIRADYGEAGAGLWRVDLP